ncbi:SERTA domain-containing protein 2 [Merluccius polli]|uniref:SERTA domain-containing protein 2 n=1 Tax=Merluccius polli TaxID=89951 RepID=A0AA47MIM8_MERPO|nr:SERTA domain-containing protein 2 [Merluccius polli]
MAVIGGLEVDCGCDSGLSLCSSRYMFGKGVKRKLDEEDDEGLEGQALASPVAPGAAGGPGPRWPEGPSKVSYTLQRQTIFNISLMKLMYSQRSPPAEPRLERRVLINNMLRRIQEELKQEGALQRPPPLLLLPPSPPPDHPMDETFREAPPTGGGGGGAMGPATPAPAMPTFPVTPAPACLTPASLLEDDDAAFCTLAPPTLPLGPSSQGTGFFPPAPASLAPGPLTAIAKTAAANTTTTSPVAPALPLPQPPPPLPLRDSRTTGPRAEVALSPAVTADDLLKSLTSPYAVAPAPQVSANQPFKIDLTELDHIMEVLVGS